MMTKEEINASDYIINAVNLEDARCKAALIEWENEQRQKNNEGKALLYAVEKTAERTKREIIEKAVKWLCDNMFYSINNGIQIDAVCISHFIGRFRQAMEE